ncbi:MAG: PulJ/GspJ family protein [Candidatus Rifleibacteriota bacterium]
MNSKNRNCRGFTLIEILIAAGVLSLFMTGVFSLYRSGAKGFVAGTWRAEEQKRAQLFLSALSRDLSMANPALLRIEDDGSQTVVQNTPIYVNNNMFRLNTTPVFMDANTKNWTCLLAFSISYPYLEANATFATPLENGKWSGVAIWVKERRVRYVRTSDPNFYSSHPVGMPGAIVEFPGPGTVGPSAEFRPDPDQNRNRDFDFNLDQIACVATGTSLASPGVMEFICRFVRIEGGKKTDGEIVQNVTVKLASMTPIVTF